jgi:hypothetical protein
LLGTRHAIEMLAQSERKGCALGAAVAMVLDWASIRTVLDAAGQRFGVTVRPHRLARTADVAALVDTACVTASLERALLFGAGQIALQHHGLWDLLEARAEARGDG